MHGGLNLSREIRRAMDRESATLPLHLVDVPLDRGTPPPGCYRVMRSRGFMVQFYRATATDPLRLSIHRTSSDGNRWHDGITWDDLQRLKREAGFGDQDAVEIYPRDADVVNVANIRHLWIIEDGVAFAWRRRR